MRYRARELSLWLLVINLGIACGAGLYEARVVIPGWADLPVEHWPNTGLTFWIFVTTVPLTLLTIINAIAVAKETHPRRSWWRNAVIVLGLERVATFSYFIPRMIVLMSGNVPQSEVGDGLAEWMALNHGRHVLSLSAWLLALKALSTPPSAAPLPTGNARSWDKP